MTKLATQLIQSLEDFVDGSADIYGDDILREIFFFCRECKQSSTKPRNLLTTARANVDDLLLEAIPLLDQDIGTRVNILGQESAQMLRITRSGLAFLEADIACPKFKKELKKLMEGEAVETLNEMLTMWKAERAEYDYGDSPIDLRGVPAGHHWWWSQLEQADSKRVFGNNAADTVSTKRRRRGNRGPRPANPAYGQQCNLRGNRRN